MEIAQASLEARIDFVQSHTAIAEVPFVPEVRLYSATDLTPLWRATQAWLGQVGLDVPFWCVPWAGGQALARYVLDHPEEVRGRDVIDFGSGSGLVAIAAVKAGAARVTAIDIDPLAEAAIALNCRENGVSVNVSLGDVVGKSLQGDVLLAGDVWYERAPAHRFATWFGKLARRGMRVITGDPERAYVPERLKELARYEVEAAADLERSPIRVARVLAWSARVAAMLLVLLGLTREAHADAKTSALSWVRLPGTESCIPTAELGARVEKHLGRTVLASPSVADISIEGRVERAPGGKFHAVVGGSRRDGATIGTREMTSTGNDCRTLDDGLVLVIALMIDPDAMSPAPPPSPEPAPLPPPPVVTHEIVREHVIEIDHVPPASTWRTEASLRGEAAFERVPGVAPGVALAFRAGPSRLAAFQVSAAVVPGGSLRVGSPSVSYTMIEGGLAWCPTRALGARVAIGGCAGLRFGAVHASGDGFATSRDVDRGFADLAVGPELSVDVAGPVYVLASAMGLVHFVREKTLATNGNGQPYSLDETGALGAELGIGVGVHFSP